MTARTPRNSRYPGMNHSKEVTMRKLLTLVLVAAMVLSLSVLAGAVNCPTNEDVGYENSGYFFAQDARNTEIEIDGFKDDIFGDTPSFSYKSTGNATEDNVGAFTDVKNWVFISGGTWEDVQAIVNPSNYVEGYFAWDANYLYFFIHQDLGSFKQGQTPDLMWQDYCIQIEFIDFKAKSFSDWGCSVSQSTGETMQYCFVNGGCTCPVGATNYNVKVTADGSYVAYEGAIPVDDFFAKSAIEEGSTLGFNLCINFGDISQGGKQKCLTWAADNYHARSGDSAIPITLLGPSTTIEDALNAQAEAERMIKDAAEETDGKGILFTGCNNTDNLSGATLTRETVKSGSGAWSFTLGEHNFRYTPSTAVDGSQYDSLEFDLYIADDSVVAAMRSDNGCIELTSAGQPDNHEIAWNMSQILDGIEGGAKSGWNHVVLYFKDAGKTGEDIDLSAINFLRFFDITNTNKTEGAIDNIRLTSALADKEKKESESLAKWERQSRQAYERESLQKAKEESESLHKAELESLEAASRAAAAETKDAEIETEPASNAGKKSGCGSVIAAGAILLVATGIAGTALVINRKEH